MTWPDIYLICFWVGALWSVASLLLGGAHLGHTGGHGHFHVGHGHGGAGHGHAHGPVKIGNAHANDSVLLGWLGAMANPSSVAVFLAWFGGVGYLLTRHTGLAFWSNLAIAIALGLVGSSLLAAFLRFLQSKEQPMNAADYEMVGTLGRVTCPIRADGVGEMIYVRDGARRPVPVRSEDGQAIARDEEVIVTRFEKGIAYVRTWDSLAGTGTLDSKAELASGARAVAGDLKGSAMTQSAQAVSAEKTLQKETKNVR